jgi:hypothetical protein
MAHNVRKSIAMWHFLHWNAQLESFTQNKTNRKTRKFYFIYFTRKLLLGKSF